MIISVAHQKGGVGKSIIAFNLVTSFIADGFEVEVVDLDTQKTVTDIKRIRDLNDNLKTFKIHYLKNTSEFEDFIKNKDDKKIYIIDSGGFDSAMNRNAIYFADLVVTPVSDKFTEISGLMLFKSVLNEISELAKQEVKVNVLLNGISPQVKNNDGVENFIRQQKEFDLMNNIIHQRVDFDKSLWAGKGLNEYKKYSPASKEFQKFYQEVKEKIKIK